LLKKHTELKIIQAEEVAKLKNTDPVQIGRDLKAEAVMVVLLRWEPYDIAKWGKLRSNIGIYETETGHRVANENCNLLICPNEDREKTSDDGLQTALAEQAMEIVKAVKTAAPGRH